ncbi:MAG: hypothetical protein JSV61_06400 [Anaerolineales bacterium]|nr:MAG: hypothetical protein JSV61_06400 [Anaerolineales bacterium]
MAPTIGYADLIIALVSSGTTLRDNCLKTLHSSVKILHASAASIS